MTKSTDIDKMLQDHEKRILALEQSSQKPTKQKVVKDKKSLPDHIIGLRDKGFFTQPKTADEVHKKLQSIYHCEPNRVSVALVRLGGKSLRKASKKIGGKKYKAYVW